MLNTVVKSIRTPIIEVTDSALKTGLTLELIMKNIVVIGAK